MKQKDIDLLAKKGWIVTCESPFEIEKTVDGITSTATLLAAEFILKRLQQREKQLNRRKKYLDKIINK